MVSQYEKDKIRQTEKNRELLRSLGLEKPLFEPKEKPRKKAPPPKRKAAEDGEENAPVARVKRLKVVDQSPHEGLRRSSRNAEKKIDYANEKILDSPQPIIGNKTSGNDGPMGREAGKRLHDPKVFGHIPGVVVGTWWLTREACSRDAIHAPWVGGISGGPEGAHSVVLSGGYDDDVDLGYAFTYTGSGGRDLKGTKAVPKNLRTAPQSSDQSFDNHFNKMLKISCETKKPIRVVRGFKVRSKYAPSEGYRYDGLYTVEKAWMEKGLNQKGYLVCKYAFKRLPGQPPLLVREDYIEEEEAATDETESTEAD